jgi:hypothetical protein
MNSTPFNYLAANQLSTPAPSVVVMQFVVMWITFRAGRRQRREHRRAEL